MHTTKNPTISLTSRLRHNLSMHLMRAHKTLNLKCQMLVSKIKIRPVVDSEKSHPRQTFGIWVLNFLLIGNIWRCLFQLHELVLLFICKKLPRHVSSSLRTLFVLRIYRTFYSKLALILGLLVQHSPQTREQPSCITGSSTNPAQHSYNLFSGGLFSS